MPEIAKKDRSGHTENTVGQQTEMKRSFFRPILSSLAPLEWDSQRLKWRYKKHPWIFKDSSTPMGNQRFRSRVFKTPRGEQNPVPFNINIYSKVPFRLVSVGIEEVLICNGTSVENQRENWLMSVAWLYYTMTNTLGNFWSPAYLIRHPKWGKK